MQQKVDLGADRTALLEGTALRCRQREEQDSVALGEAITVKIVERKVGHATAGSNGKTRSIADIRASMPAATTERAVVCL